MVPDVSSIELGGGDPLRPKPAPPIKLPWWLHKVQPEPEETQTNEIPEIPKAQLKRYWAPQIDPHPAHAGRFLTFEPWNGGFNNRRMSLEMAWILAYLFNRTLVLPPPRKVAQMSGHEDVGYEDFFDFWDLGRLVPVMPYDQYRHLRPQKKYTVDCGVIRHPQSLKFCMAFADERLGLNGAVSIADWDFSGGVFCYPRYPNSSDSYEIEDFKAFAGKRIPQLLEDNETATVLHFPQVLFGNFYNAIWSHDHEWRRQIKILVRDHVHFSTPILSRATRIARFLGEDFAALHIRRTDFARQYKNELIGASSIIDNVKALIPKNSTVYIASDEKVAGYYKPFASHFRKVYRLSDILPLFHKNDWTPPHHYPCIEQLVCAMATKFVGTRYSTFSGYIVRLRGYMEMEDTASYFTDTRYKEDRPVVEDTPYGWSKSWAKNPWAREFPEAWADLHL